MPLYMPHYCGNASRNLEARLRADVGAKCGAMHERQRPIAEWMKEVVERRGISARAWAEKAGLGKDTVSRAIREGYEHVTTTTTIAKLADALNEKPYGAAGGIPSVSSLASILTVVHQAMMGEKQPEPDVIQGLAAALRDTLLHLADEPEALDDPRLSNALARASVRSLGRSSSSTRRT